MTERVISVKVPASLIKALDQQRKNDHYLDLSEQVRSIVRKKCLEFTNPYTEGIKQIKQDLKQKAATQTAREQILQDLLKLLKEEEQ